MMNYRDIVNLPKIQAFKKHVMEIAFPNHKEHETHHQQLKFISRASLLEEAYLPFRFRRVILLVSLITTLIIIWASIAKIKEVAKAVGEVVPSSSIQVIQHLEGGNIAHIYVKDGEIVEKSQKLIDIAGEAVHGELERAEAKYEALKLDAERYRSFANYTEADFKRAEKDLESLAKEQQEALKIMIDNRQKQIDVLTEQIKQKKQNLKMSESRLETLTKNLPLYEESFEKKKNLFEQKLIVRNIMLEAEKDFNNLTGDISKTKIEVEQEKQAITEFENRLQSLESGLKNEAYQKLSELEGQIAENKEVVLKLKDQISRQNIVSPVEGIVHNMQLKTVGGVVSPGQKLMEIVPTQGNLEAEIKITPNDIGNVEKGQKCLVKVGTFDFSRYGGIEGEIISVSPSTYISSDNLAYYKANVSLSKNYVGNDPLHNHLRPGNIINVDIIIGEKSIVAYLLKPIRNALSKAFSEK